MSCPRDICPICGYEPLNYDRDYPDEVYCCCPQCGYRAFDHYKKDE